MKKLMVTALLVMMSIMCFSVTGCSEKRDSNESIVTENLLTENGSSTTTTKMQEYPSILALEVAMQETSAKETTTETISGYIISTNTTAFNTSGSTAANKPVSNITSIAQASVVTTESYQPVETTYVENTPVYTGEKISYVVKAGDTLSKIALNYNTTVISIMECNELPSENFIIEGQLLDIPVNNSYEAVYEEYYEETPNNNVSYNDPNGSSLISCSVTKYTTCSEWSSWENIMMAADRINEIGCIGPWGDFNWFRDIGTCDSDPWKPASVYIGNSVGVDYGGGICFPSTVLMLAEEQCGLTTLEKHPHTREVSYNPRPIRENYGDYEEYEEALRVALSKEAAIDASGLNLVFTNPTSDTVYIHVDVNPGAGSVTVTMTVA